MTRQTCPALAELTELVAGRAKKGVASHVDSCERCARLVEIARRAVDAKIAPALLAESARDVDLLVDSLLELPPAERMRAAAADEYLRTGVARRFSDLAIEAWETDLNVALDHIRVATLIADRLAMRSGPSAELEFETWKNRSTIHRERGETDAARACLTKAANAINRCEDRELKRAVVWYADAAICASRDVWEPRQALELLARAERVFLIRDGERRRAVRTLRAVVQLHSGEYDRAIEEFRVVLAEVDPRNLAARADAARNLANAMLQGGATDDQTEFLLEDARTIDSSLGRELQVVRDDALRALLMLGRDDFEAAVHGFSDARRRFAALGEHESALLAGKDLAVALVALDRVAEASAVLRELVAASSMGGSDRKRFTAEALDYLRSLAQREELTLDIASMVGAYIDRIHVQRAAPFRPPMSPLTM